MCVCVCVWRGLREGPLVRVGISKIRVELCTCVFRVLGKEQPRGGQGRCYSEPRSPSPDRAIKPAPSLLLHLRSSHTIHHTYNARSNIAQPVWTHCRISSELRARLIHAECTLSRHFEHLGIVWPESRASLQE